MSGKVSSLSRRLARMENALAEAAERKRLANCICKYHGVTHACSEDPWSFEAEMNQRCPVHGFRHLGRIQVYYLDEEGPTNDAIDALVAEYLARLNAWQSSTDHHDSKESGVSL
jgi:hypothetical protein